MLSPHLFCVIFIVDILLRLLFLSLLLLLIVIALSSFCLLQRLRGNRAKQSNLMIKCMYIYLDAIKNNINFDYFLPIILWKYFVKYCITLIKLYYYYYITHSTYSAIDSSRSDKRGLGWPEQAIFIIQIRSHRQFLDKVFKLKGKNVNKPKIQDLSKHLLQHSLLLILQFSVLESKWIGQPIRFKFVVKAN